MKISKRLEDIKEISLVAYLYIIVYKKKTQQLYSKTFFSSVNLQFNS